jgi:hypothetical protein
MHWITRTIVCGFATASISIPLFSVMVGCSADYMIYGGIGEQISAGPVWERENGQTYGKIGARAEKMLHERDQVGFYADIHHKSHPGDRDRGEENLEAGFYKRF